MDPALALAIEMLIQSNNCAMNAKTPIAMYWKAEARPSDTSEWTYKGIERGFMGQMDHEVWIKPNTDFTKFSIDKCPVNQQAEYQHYYEPRDKR